MTMDELIALLHENGFDSEWTLSDGVLVQWGHEADPPAPLTRPQATDETPSAD
jgi:hypothetical protein